MKKLSVIIVLLLVFTHNCGECYSETQSIENHSVQDGSLTTHEKDTYKFEVKDYQEIPTPEELSNRFGNSFKAKFLQKLKVDFSWVLSNQSGVELISDFIETYDFSLLEDEFGSLKLEVVHSYVTAFNRPYGDNVPESGKEIRDRIPRSLQIKWGSPGMTINPGIYHPCGNKERYPKTGFDGIFTDPIILSTDDGGEIRIILCFEVVPYV